MQTKSNNAQSHSICNSLISHFLVRIQNSRSLLPLNISALQNSGVKKAFDKAVGSKLKAKLAFNNIAVLNFKGNNLFFASVKQVWEAEWVKTSSAKAKTRGKLLFFAYRITLLTQNWGKQSRWSSFQLLNLHAPDVGSAYLS